MFSNSYYTIYTRANKFFVFLTHNLQYVATIGKKNDNRIFFFHSTFGTWLFVLSMDAAFCYKYKFFSLETNIKRGKTFLLFCSAISSFFPLVHTKWLGSVSWWFCMLTFYVTTSTRIAMCLINIEHVERKSFGKVWKF